MNRPCSCDRFTPGEAYQAGQCRLCWLYANDARYTKLWSEPAEPPTIIGGVKKSAEAVAEWIAAGSPLRTTEELGECFDICRDCEEYQPHPIARCGKCGCFLSAKARMATEACPLGKWPVATNSTAGP